MADISVEDIHCLAKEQKPLRQSKRIDLDRQDFKDSCLLQVVSYLLSAR